MSHLIAKRCSARVSSAPPKAVTVALWRVTINPTSPRWCVLAALDWLPLDAALAAKTPAPTGKLRRKAKAARDSSRDKLSAPQWIRTTDLRLRRLSLYVMLLALSVVERPVVLALRGARARDPQRRTRRLDDEPPRAAEGPTAARLRHLPLRRGRWLPQRTRGGGARSQCEARRAG